MMIGKMKVVALLFSFLVVGSSAALALSQDQESDLGGRASLKTVYKAHLAEVEAYYDHEIYILISSDNGGPVSGFVEILPPKLMQKECKDEGEKKECREDKKEKDCTEEPEEEAKEKEEEQGVKEEKKCGEGEKEGEKEEGCEKEREDEPKKGCCCCDKEKGSDDGKECKEGGHKKHCRKKEERKHHWNNCFRFHFKDGKGKILLFPSSHRCVGATAMIAIRSAETVKITPFIYVKDTDVVVYPDSKDEEGKYCEIKKIKGATRYGFEDLMDSPEYECDWDYDDVVLYMGKVQKKENLNRVCEKEVQKDKR